MDDGVESPGLGPQRLAGYGLSHRRPTYRRFRSGCEWIRRCRMARRIPGLQPLRMGCVWELLSSLDADIVVASVVWRATSFVSVHICGGHHSLICSQRGEERQFCTRIRLEQYILTTVS